MFRNLCPGAIGLGGSLEERIQFAQAGRFEGLDVDIRDLVDEGASERLLAALEEAGLRIGGCGLPVDWRANEDDYRADLSRLPGLAGAAAQARLTRFYTYLPSWSDDRDFTPNFNFHVERFRPIAEILGARSCRLGLEFLGPVTLRQGHRFEFIHTLDGMLQLCGEIGKGNVGLLLDAWHWYTSGGTVEQLRGLSDTDVVYVHVNDAPEGVPISQHIDNVRCLPGETGVIDLPGFLGALREIGYTGPVTPEPFSKELEPLGEGERARRTGEALLQSWKDSGLGACE